MNIQLNDQPLDVTIAESETLGEVVRDLESWLKGTDLVLYSVRHEERELLSRPEQEWAAIPQGQVDTLRVTVKPARELALLNLQAVTEYLDLLASQLNAQADKAQVLSLPQGLLDGYPAMAQSYLRHFPDSRAALQSLEVLLNGAASGGAPSGDVLSDQAPTARTRAEQALMVVERLRERVALRLGELADPREALRMLAGALERCIGEITEVSILLQTGRNRRAMEIMIRFSELSQDLVRVVGRELGGFPIEGRSLAEFLAELNGILAELIEAFGARDSVLIGDLMEYEIAPRLRTVRAFLRQHDPGG